MEKKKEIIKKKLAVCEICLQTNPFVGSEQLISKNSVSTCLLEDLIQSTG